MPVIACHKCRHSWKYEAVLGRADECPACHFDAHVCLNCQFYDRNAHHECREPEADFVKEKAEGNFCDYFAPIANRAAVNDQDAAAKSALSALFAGEKSPTTAPPGASLEEELKKFLNKK